MVSSIISALVSLSCGPVSTGSPPLTRSVVADLRRRHELFSVGVSQIYGPASRHGLGHAELPMRIVHPVHRANRTAPAAVRCRTAGGSGRRWSIRAAADVGRCLRPRRRLLVRRSDFGVAIVAGDWFLAGGCRALPAWPAVRRWPCRGCGRGSRRARLRRRCLASRGVACTALRVGVPRRRSARCRERRWRRRSGRWCWRPRVVR
jgi:hypothetical protein